MHWIQKAYFPFVKVHCRWAQAGLRWRWFEIAGTWVRVDCVVSWWADSLRWFHRQPGAGLDRLFLKKTRRWESVSVLFTWVISTSPFCTHHIKTPEKTRYLPIMTITFIIKGDVPANPPVVEYVPLHLIICSLITGLPTGMRSQVLNDWSTYVHHFEHGVTCL